MKYPATHIGENMKEFDNAFDAGYDYSKNGADEDNCNFKWFGSKDSLSEWERGRDAFVEEE